MIILAFVIGFILGFGSLYFALASFCSFKTVKQNLIAGFKKKGIAVFQINQADTRATAEAKAEAEAQEVEQPVV